MTPVARRIERLANRGSFLRNRQVDVLQRFLSRIQDMSRDANWASFSELTDELEKVVKSEEALAAERRAA